MKTAQYLSYSGQDILYLKKLLANVYGIRDASDSQVVSHAVLKCPFHKTALLMAAKNRSLFTYATKDVQVDDDISAKILAYKHELNIKDTKVVLSCLLRLMVNLYKIKFIDTQESVLT